MIPEWEAKTEIPNRDPSEMTVDEWDHVKHFVTPHTGIFVNLFIYMVMTYTMSIIASTLPVPTGALIPAFKIGAGLGRSGAKSGLHDSKLYSETEKTSKFSHYCPPIPPYNCSPVKGVCPKRLAARYNSNC